MSDESNYVSERRSEMINVSELDIQDESDLNLKIKYENLCKYTGVNISPDEFPVMNMFSKWRPYNFNQVIKPLKPFREVVQIASTMYIRKYIETVIESRQGSEKKYILLVDEPIRFEKTKSSEQTIQYKYPLSEKILSQIQQGLTREDIYTIVIPIKFTDQITRDPDEKETDILVFVYKNQNILEFYHPEMDEFFSSANGIEVIEFFYKPVWKKLWNDYSIKYTFDKVSSDIINDFLYMFPFMEKEGYLRKSYKSFGFLWNVYLLLQTRIISDYSKEDIERIIKKFDTFSTKIRGRFYKNFYTFLQCFSSFIWNQLRKEVKDIIRQT
jgi:hypothetical protein